MPDPQTSTKVGSRRRPADRCPESGNQYSPASGTQVVPQCFAPILRIGRLLLRNVLVSPRPVSLQRGEIQAGAILSLDVFANQDLYLDGREKGP